MKKLLTIMFLILALGVNAQMKDFLGVPKEAMIKEMSTNAKYTDVHLAADTITALYNRDMGIHIIFRDNKVFLQQIIYDRSMSNTLITYLNTFVVIEPLKVYIDFSVDPPTYYKLTWEEKFLILLLLE